MSSRNPVTPLAPLEFLQNHRRGSITDPSLHAGPTPPSFPGGPSASGISSPFRRPDSPATSFPSSAGHEPRRSFSQTRPLSPYKFGEASAQPGESPSAHLRRVLRSPSADTPDRRTPTQAMMVDSGREGGMERNGSAGESAADGFEPTRTLCLNLSRFLPASVYEQHRTGQRATTGWTSTGTRTRRNMGRMHAETAPAASRKRWTTRGGDSLW